MNDWFVAIEDEGERLFAVAYGRVESIASTSNLDSNKFVHLTRYVIRARLDDRNFLTPEGREITLGNNYDLERAKLAGSFCLLLLEI